MNRRILKKRMRGLKPRQRDRDLLRNKIKEWKREGRCTDILEFSYEIKYGKPYKKGARVPVVSFPAEIKRAWEEISAAFEEVTKAIVPGLVKLGDAISELTEGLKEEDEEICLRSVPARDKAERYQDEL